MMNQEDYIKKWLDHSLSEDERRAFEQTGDYSFLNRLDQSLKQFKAPDFDMAEEAKRLHTTKPKAKIHSLSLSTPWLRIAASVVLVVISAFVFYLNFGQKDVVRIVSDQKTEWYLPDSSFVKLNTKSLLSFNEGKWENQRQVSLEGEAFFKVAHGSRFDVITTSGTVSVVGTQFNVKNRGDYFEVACFEGKVRVVSEGLEIPLTKGQTWRALAGKSGPVDVNVNPLPDWIQGESQFRSVPFIYVIKEFERQYGTSVQTKDVNTQRLFTGSFTHDNINLALKSISLPLNLSFQLEKDQVLLSGAQ